MSISQPTTTLHRYLNQRYFMILFGLVILFVLLVLFSRYQAMDDTTNYYMHYEAEVLSDHYQLSEPIVEYDLGVKEYYWGIENLPQHYRDLLEIDQGKSLALNETYGLQYQGKFVYLLPYYHQAKGKVFFVVHIFDMENDALFYQNWHQLFILSVFILFVGVVCYSVHINKNITKQMQVFHHWITEVATSKLSDIKPQAVPERLTFEELTASAKNLQNSLLAQRQLQFEQQKLIDREKQFLSSLSHELSTPIAIMSAGLTVLTGSKDINAKDSKTLNKLKKAIQQMKQLRQVLLLLWRAEQANKQDEPLQKIEKRLFFLDELIEHLIVRCQSQFQQQELAFIVDKKHQVKLFAPYELLDMMLDNLLRNACQYSSNNRVIITLNTQSLVVENELDVTREYHLSQEPTEAANYGYGVGLVLVEKIAQYLGCQVKLTTSAHLFKAEVFFNSLIDDIMPTEPEEIA
ncbi:sensor histidine kinase [Thalassotalea insulae]|nr:histidine kinase dimerization/phospho-acceptor domain-containing protein [Thalassotalea insulae]